MYLASAIITTLAIGTATLPEAPSTELPVPPPAIAQDGSATVTEGATIADTQTLGYMMDRTRRMTVPVMVDGAGPFPFLVDTGAERTIVANDLALTLGLPAGPQLTLATVAGRFVAPSALIGRLSMATHHVDGIEAPTLDRLSLGAAGLIGVDSLGTSRVQFDFKAGELRMFSGRKRRPIAHASYGSDEIVVTARRKAGRLILSHAKVDGVDVDVIVDTGAMTSIGNLALRGKKLKHGDTVTDIDLFSVTGQKLRAQVGLLRRVSLGGVDVRTLPVAYADSYAFETLGLTKRPALLLGMDALALFDSIELDFVHREVIFNIPRGANRSEPQRFAATGLTSGG